MQDTHFVVYSAKLQLFSSFGYWGSKDLLPSKHPSLEECKAACTGQLGAHSRADVFRRLYGEYHEFRLWFWAFGIRFRAFRVLEIPLLCCSVGRLVIGSLRKEQKLLQRFPGTPPAHMRGRVWASGFGICPLSPKPGIVRPSRYRSGNSCTGIEWSPGRCEVWTSPIGSFDPTVTGFTCMKMGADASRKEWSPPW